MRLGLGTQDLIGESPNWPPQELGSAKCLDAGYSELVNWPARASSIWAGGRHA